MGEKLSEQTERFDKHVPTATQKISHRDISENVSRSLTNRFRVVFVCFTLKARSRRLPVCSICNEHS